MYTKNDKTYISIYYDKRITFDFKTVELSVQSNSLLFMSDLREERAREGCPR